MYNKTSSANFLKYGSIISKPFNKSNIDTFKILSEDNTFNKFISYDSDVFITDLEGMAMLIINDNGKLEYFVIHRNISIKKNIYFTIVPMTSAICYDISYLKNTNKKSYKLDKYEQFNNISLSLRVDNIVAYYYVVKSPNYVFKGETHYLYEFTYVDNGILETNIDGENYKIKSNQCIFYTPGQHHNQKVVSDESCSYLTIIFEASGINNELIENKTFNINKEEKTILDEFVRSSDDNSIYSNDMKILSLNTLILKIIQNNIIGKNKKSNIPITQHFTNQFLEEIISYINDNIYNYITIENISKKFSISRTYLQRLFNENLNTSPKQYINNLKLSKSKILIKTGKYSLSEISDMLGYSSIHYFSRIFTSKFNITPSEYSKKLYE